MSFADAVDRMVDDLDRVQLGDEYTPHSSTPWRILLRRWELYVTLVELIDRAVRNPFGDGSTALLLAAPALHSDDVYQLAAAIEHAGDAIRWARTSARADGRAP